MKAQRPTPIVEPTKEIGGRHFTFGKLPADKSYKVFMILVRNFGATFLAMGGTKIGKGADIGALLMKVAGIAFEKLDDDEIQFAMETLLSVTSCAEQKGGGRCSLTTTFNGQLMSAFLVCFESVKVNYSDFLAEGPLASLLAKAMAEAEESNPPTSTGSSGFPAE